MAKWLVQSQGESFDLQELKKILSDHDPTIIQDDSGFYLTSKKLDELEEARQVRDLAKHAIGLLDSAYNVHFRDTAPIAIGHITRVDEVGHRHSFLFTEEHLFLHERFRATAMVIGHDG